MKRSSPLPGETTTSDWGTGVLGCQCGRRQVIAFAVADNRSSEVQTSGALPGLEMAEVEEALARSQTEDDSTLMRWLMKTLQ